MMLMRSSSASIDLHFTETTEFDEGGYIKCIVNIIGNENQINMGNATMYLIKN